MNSRIKTKLSLSLITLLILSMTIALPISTVASPTTYVSAVNASKKYADGTPDAGYNTLYCNYTNVKQPGYPVDPNYPLGYLIVNITVTDVNVPDIGKPLRSWQINLTWDPTLLEVADKDPDWNEGDLWAPSDHVFDYDGAPSWFDKTFESGTLFWGVALHTAALPGFNGSGTLCIVKFNVTQVPSSTLECPIDVVTSGMVITKLITAGALLITFTGQDGYYKYEYVAPPTPSPRLEVYPTLVEQGKPMGPPITGTSKALFDVEIRIHEDPAHYWGARNESNLVLIQFEFQYNTTLLRRLNASKLPADETSGLNATEGDFMQDPSWAPYGTAFFTKELGPGDDIVINLLKPAPGGGGYNWSTWPDSTGLTGTDLTVAIFHFETILQYEFPWSDSCDLELKRLLHGTPFECPLFYNKTLGSLDPKPYVPQLNGTYEITGWILGKQIDVFTQYPYPYGGQGLYEHSDMFEPQKTIILYANVTYNADPVQNKLVTFQIVPPKGSHLGNFTRTAATNETGTANVTFGIPWPCFNATRDVLGTWNVTAKVDIMCEVVYDYVPFKVNYYVMNLTVIPLVDYRPDPSKPYGFKKGTFAKFLVNFTTFSEQDHDVLITLVVYDDLGVPVGSDSLWLTIGGMDRKAWCTDKPYEKNLTVWIPKWAFVGIGTVYVNALTDWPWDCGSAYCPEAWATFLIYKYYTW